MIFSKKSFFILVWVTYISVCALFFFYLLALYFNDAGLPIDDASVNPNVYFFGFPFMFSLGFVLLTQSNKFDLMALAHGYSAGTEMFFHCLVFIFSLAMLKLYFKDILPVM